MGQDKSTLPFGRGETMLARIVRILRHVIPAGQITCVAAPGQSLPMLPDSVRVAHDPETGGGPLVGLAAGLAELPPGVDAVYVTGCDMPLVVPAFVSRMFDLLGEASIVAPHDGQLWHPLAAVYRVEVRDIVQALLAARRTSLIALLEAAGARRVSADDLRQVDPQLLSLVSCNTADEYAAALLRAGV
jgi:molybdopterin-guanine dinucleotide biosynthesis protein A